MDSNANSLQAKSLDAATNGSAGPVFEAISTTLAKTLDMEYSKSTAAIQEGEPLLHPQSFEELDEENESFLVDPMEGIPSQRRRGEGSRSTVYLILLTTCIAGLQIGLSVEMSGLSPFLLSLGVSKSILALIWIAGPLSGVLVQPYVGIRSDNLRSRWGRRRPFLVGGVLSAGIAFVVLSWTRELVGGFLGIFGFLYDSTITQTSCEMFATILVMILDFSLNIIGASVRAFIVDCVPTHQQQVANAWASRITGIGSMVGYLSGYVDLPRIFPFLGNTQFKGLCAIAFISLLITSAISCTAIQERDSRTLGVPDYAGRGLISFFKSLIRSMRNLPPQIRGVCFVQVFAWIGWFPFLVYITTYVGGMYAEPYLIDNPNMSKYEFDAIMERGTRIGTYALLIFAITTFTSSVFIPLFITPMYKAPDGSSQPNATKRPIFVDRTLRAISLKRLRIPWLTLRRAWLMSHVVYVLIIWSSLFVSNTAGATILVGAVGVPWALTTWAPFALIAAEISRRDAIRRGLRTPKTPEERHLATGGVGDEGSSDQAGIVLGIHNVAISAPQVLATLMSSVIFKMLQKPRGVPGDHSVGWTLRLLSIFALVAAYVTTKYVHEGDEDEKD